jgi:hypothetical protein
MSKFSKKLILAGQISTVHSTDEKLHVTSVDKHLKHLNSEVPIDILIIGWEEIPELFDHLTSAKGKMSDLYLSSEKGTIC